MARVLLSFLGTGSYDKANREYNNATYKFDGEEQTFSDTFFAGAIHQAHRLWDQPIGRTILIGTQHSMWEQVYTEAVLNNQIRNQHIENVDNGRINAISQSIRTFAQSATHSNNPDEGLGITILPQTGEKIDNKTEIEKELPGDNSKVILIHYGINENELRNNATKILEIESLLGENDELILDVTHSFRSLPIFAMNLLIYLRNVSTKNINISHIYYGMMEMRGENNDISPVVDLKNSILKTQDWITAAYAFKEFGNTYQISNLIVNDNSSTENDRLLARKLEFFSNILNLNHLNSMNILTPQLNSVKESFDNKMARIVVDPVVDNFISKFQDLNYIGFIFLRKLAQEYKKQKKYLQALISIHEASISYILEVSGFRFSGEQNNYRRLLLDGRNVTFDNIYKLRNTVKDHIRTFLKGEDNDNYRNSLDEEKILIINLLSPDGMNRLRPFFLKLNNHRNNIAHINPQNNVAGDRPDNVFLNTLNNSLNIMRGLPIK